MPLSSNLEPHHCHACAAHLYGCMHGKETVVENETEKEPRHLGFILSDRMACFYGLVIYLLYSRVNWRQVRSAVGARTVGLLEGTQGAKSDC